MCIKKQRVSQSILVRASNVLNHRIGLANSHEAMNGETGTTRSLIARACWIIYYTLTVVLVIPYDTLLRHGVQKLGVIGARSHILQRRQEVIYFGCCRWWIHVEFRWNFRRPQIRRLKYGNRSRSGLLSSSTPILLIRCYKLWTSHLHKLPYLGTNLLFMRDK